MYKSSGSIYDLLMESDVAAFNVHNADTHNTRIMFGWLSSYVTRPLPRGDIHKLILTASIKLIWASHHVLTASVSQNGNFGRFIFV